MGNFFTDDAKPADFLSQYASVYNTVEGNTTFYNTPSPETISRWGENVPSNFKFCFKFPRVITHEQKLHHVEKQALDFVRLFEPIKNNVGPFMIQLPPVFSPNDLMLLEKLLIKLPKYFQYAVEVRHPQFYDQGNNEHNLIKLLQSFNVERVVFDTRRLHLSNSKDASILEAKKQKPQSPVRFKHITKQPMLRFIATNDILNSEPYLKEWAIVVADWINSGLKPYIFIHTPEPVHQPTLSNHFHKLLSNLIKIEALPEWPINKHNKQLGLF